MFPLESRKLPNSLYGVPTLLIFHLRPLGVTDRTYLQKNMNGLIKQNQFKKYSISFSLYIVYTQGRVGLGNNFAYTHTYVCEKSMQFHLPNEFRKSVIRFILAVITSIYSRFAQSW